MNKEQKEICPSCNEFEVYSKKLTDGLCLNCHHDREESRKEMEIEFEHDYHQGLI